MQMGALHALHFYFGALEHVIFNLLCWTVARIVSVTFCSGLPRSRLTASCNSNFSVGVPLIFKI